MRAPDSIFNISFTAGGDGKPQVFNQVAFQACDERTLRLLISSEDERIKNGGAAMTAYARLQYEEMYEREQIVRGLKKYC